MKLYTMGSFKVGFRRVRINFMVYFTRFDANADGL